MINENISQKKVKQRQAGIELLRIIAMLLIVMQHFAEHTTFPSTVLFNKYLLSFLLLGGGIGVNIFVMISGYFYTSEFKTKKLLILVLETLFYSIIMTIVAVITGATEFRLKLFPRALFPFVFKGGEYWFISIYMLMYIATPIIQPSLKNIGRRQLGLIIIIFLFLYSIFPYTIGKILALQDLGYSKLCWFFLMYLCGAYIRKNKQSIKTKDIIFLIVCVLVMISSKALLVMEISKNEILLTALATKYRNGIMQALIAYLMVKNFAKIDFKADSIFYIVSSCTFGVYLIHNHLLFNDYLWRNILQTSKFVEYYYFPLYAIGVILLVFCSCAFLDYLRKKIIEERIISFLPFNKLCNSIDSWLKQA